MEYGFVIVISIFMWIFYCTIPRFEAPSVVETSLENKRVCFCEEALLSFAGCIGNNIEFLSDTNVDQIRVMGFTPYRNWLEKGRYFWRVSHDKFGASTDNIDIFYVESVEKGNDPSDMFFAECTFIGKTSKDSKFVFVDVDRTNYVPWHNYNC